MSKFQYFGLNNFYPDDFLPSPGFFFFYFLFFLHGQVKCCFDTFNFFFFSINNHLFLLGGQEGEFAFSCEERVNSARDNSYQI